MTPLPVEFAKDTTAAWVAELVAGQGRRLRNYLYIFIGTFIGGGLVIDSHLHPGSTEMPALSARCRCAAKMARSRRNCFTKRQDSCLSKYSNSAATRSPPPDERALSRPTAAQTALWLNEACPALALIITSATALLDLDAVVVDGSMHRTLIDKVIAETARVLDSYIWEGLTRPQLFAGSIGARAMGGALLPLYAHFAPNCELFLKTETA